MFEENLINEGLELEKDSPIDGLYFVKIHAPMEVLRRYSEILKLRMPMREVRNLTMNINSLSLFALCRYERR